MNSLVLFFAFWSGRWGLGFGDGFGIAQPHWDGVFYWLLDQEGKKRGCWYHWIGGFGAQLDSFEFRSPKPGETRKLFGHTFYIFGRPVRKLFVVRTTWAVSTKLKTNEDIRSLKENLNNWNGI